VNSLSMISENKIRFVLYFVVDLDSKKNGLHVDEMTRANILGT